MSRKTFGIIVASIGTALIAISALADVIGIGSGGFGARQIAGQARIIRAAIPSTSSRSEDPPPQMDHWTPIPPPLHGFRLQS